MMGEEDSVEASERLATESRALRAELEALRGRCALLHAVTELIPEPVYVKDTQGRYLMINGAGARVLGKTVEEVIGRDDTELFEADAARTIVEADRQAIAEVATVTSEHTLTVAGVARTYHYTKGPYRDDRGHVIGVIGISRDITERKRAEESLHEAREFLVRLLDHAPALIYATDHDGRRRLVNRAWEETCRQRREGVIGYPLERSLPPEVARRFGEENQRVIETGMPLNLEQVVDLPDGQRYLHTVKFPLRNAAGEIESVGGISLDITERKRAEEALREAREFVVRLLDHAPALIYVSTRDGRRRLVNRAWEEMYRSRREDVIGCTLEQIFPPEVARRFAEENQRIIETGTPMALEQSIDLPDGRHEFHTVKFPLYNAAGQIEAVGGISVDITGRKRDEEALREYAQRLQALSGRMVELQEQERRHLARELHDEIGLVLSVISVNLHALKGRCDAAAWPRIEETIQIADRATQQVRNLSLDLRPAMLDDIGLVAAVRWLVDRQAQRAGLIAHFVDRTSGGALPPDLVITCFRVVQEALANVLRHAQARQVWVGLGQDDDAVDLLFRDDGVGFDPETARRRAARGESFGLLGVQERISLLGGELVIDSKPGHGTTLRARLPVASAPSAEDSGRGS